MVGDAVRYEDANLGRYEVTYRGNPWIRIF